MSRTVTVGDLANQVHRMVKGSRREAANWLAADVTASDTTFTFADADTGITVGSYLGVDDEIVYVRAAPANSASATVRRGMFNTTAAAHDSDTAIEVNWRWFTADVVDAIVDEIRSWADDVFQVASLDVSVPACSQQVVAGVDELYRFPLEFQSLVPGRDRWVGVKAGVAKIIPGPDGLLATVPAQSTAWTLRVTYAQTFDVETVGRSTPLGNIGLPVSLHDAAKYGAAARLLIDREPQRSAVESQPEPRQAADVRAGSSVQMGAAYRQLADERLAQEAARLRERYPYRAG